MSLQDVAATARTVTFNPVQGKDIDAELERSLTNEWDAQIVTYPNERFPFNEWILNRIRGMGYPLKDLDYPAHGGSAAGNLQGHEAALRRY